MAKFSNLYTTILKCEWTEWSTTAKVKIVKLTWVLGALVSHSLDLPVNNVKNLFPNASQMLTHNILLNLMIC